MAGDFTLVSSFLASYVLLATHRALYLTQLFLQERAGSVSTEGLNPQNALASCNPQHSAAEMEGFQTQCVQLLDYITSAHLDLCFDRHMSVIIACRYRETKFSELV